MWQRFTERARRVVFFAQEEAGRLGENYVSTEHLLLGMLREEDTVACRILNRLGVSLTALKAKIEAQVTRGDGRLGQDMQLTPRAKQVIDLAYDEARLLTNNYIGTEHLLLGLIHEREGLAGRVLTSMGVDLEQTRREVMLLQDNDSSAGHLQEVDHIVWATQCVRRDSLGLRGKSLLSITDLTAAQLAGILRVTAAMESAHKSERHVIRWNYPKSLALVFEKPSLRTRVTFDLGMRQMGGLTVVLGPQEIGLGTRESIPDAARNLERWVDAIMARVFDHNTLIGLRDNCKIPIINGLSDREHPCQILADLYTIQQKKGKLEGIKVAWVGDGYNVLHSLLLGGALAGMTIHAACPVGYEPDPAIVEQARALAANDAETQGRGDTGTTTQRPNDRILLTTNPIEAVTDSDVVMTDVWTSMGQEEEKAKRLTAFAGFQVNAALMAHAKPDAIFMHCLPAHRGEEVADEVIDGPQSVVFDEAENRMYAQKAVLALLLGA